MSLRSIFLALSTAVVAPFLGALFFIVFVIESRKPNPTLKDDTGLNAAHPGKNSSLQLSTAGSYPTTLSVRAKQSEHFEMTPIPSANPRRVTIGRWQTTLKRDEEGKKPTTHLPAANCVDNDPQLVPLRGPPSKMTLGGPCVHPQ